MVSAYFPTRVYKKMPKYEQEVIREEAIAREIGNQQRIQLDLGNTKTIITAADILEADIKDRICEIMKSGEHFELLDGRTMINVA